MITFNNNRVTISSFKQGTTGISTATELVDASGTFEATDVGRFVLVDVNTFDTADIQVRQIVGFVDANTVTIHDPWRTGSIPAASKPWRMSHSLDDVFALGIPEIVKTGERSYYWAADWLITADGFLADIDCSLEMLSQGQPIGWEIQDRGVVQFGILWGGEKGTSTETTNGCNLFFKTLTVNHSIYTSQTSFNPAACVVNYYGCRIDSETANPSSFMFQRMAGPVRYIGCNFDGPMGGRFLNGNTEWADCRHTGNVDATPAWSIGASFARSPKNITFFRNNTCLKTFSNYLANFEDITFTDSNSNILLIQGSGGTANFLDCTTFTSIDLLDQGSGTINQLKSVNYVATDPSSSPVQDLKVAIKDKNGTLQGAVSLTGTNGVCPQINALFSQFVDDTNEVNFFPFVINIRKYGTVYQTFTSPIADPIKQGLVIENNPFITLTEAQALAITGVSINPANDMIMLTEMLTAEDLYQYSQAWAVQDANMAELEPIKTTDGTNYTLSPSCTIVYGMNGSVSSNFSVNGKVQLNAAGVTITGLTASILIIPNAGSYTLVDCKISKVQNTSTGQVDIASNTSVGTVENIGVGAVTNILDTTVTVITPAGFDDTITVYPTLNDAETQNAGAVLATGSSYSYDSQIQGGVTVFYRMQSVDGRYIIDNLILPLSPGINVVNLVVTNENAALAQLVTSMQDVHGFTQSTNDNVKAIIGLTA